MLKLLIIVLALVIQTDASFGRRMYPTGNLSPAENNERLEKCGNTEKQQILPPYFISPLVTLEGLQYEGKVMKDSMWFDVQAVMVSKRHLIADVILIKNKYNAEECRDKKKDVLSMLEKNSRNIVKATLMGDCLDDQPFGFLLLESDWPVDHHSYACVADHKPKVVQQCLDDPGSCSETFNFAYWNPPEPNITPMITGYTFHDHVDWEVAPRNLDLPKQFHLRSEIQNQVGAVYKLDDGKFTIYGQISSRSPKNPSLYFAHAIHGYENEICEVSGICQNSTKASDECMNYWTAHEQKQGALSPSENNQRLDLCANASAQGFQDAHPIVEIPGGTGWSDTSYDPPVFLPTRGYYVSSRHVITDMILIQKKYNKEDCERNNKDMMSMLEMNEFKIVKATLIGECRDEPYGFLLLETAWPTDHAYGCIRHTIPNWHENERMDNEQNHRIYPGIYDTDPNTYTGQFRQQTRSGYCHEQTDQTFCAVAYYTRRDHFREPGLTLDMEWNTPRRKTKNWMLAGITIQTTPQANSQPISVVLSIHGFLDQICAASGICKEKADVPSDDTPFKSKEVSAPEDCLPIPSDGHVVWTPDSTLPPGSEDSETSETSPGMVPPTYVPAPVFTKPTDSSGMIPPTYVPAPVFTKSTKSGCLKCSGSVAPTYVPAPVREGPWSIPKMTVPAETTTFETTTTTEATTTTEEATTTTVTTTEPTTTTSTTVEPATTAKSTTVEPTTTSTVPTTITTSDSLNTRIPGAPVFMSTKKSTSPSLPETFTFSSSIDEIAPSYTSTQATSDKATTTTGTPLSPVTVKTSRPCPAESAEKTADDENRPKEEKKPNPYDQIFALETKYKTDYEDMKKGKHDKKELRQSQIGSIFDPISGPSVPAVSGVNGVKNKMKWKIDVDPIELNGDQKMQEVLEKLKELRKNSGLNPCKVLKANEHMMSNSDDEPTEELIHMSARILQLVKMEALISKEISKEDQELLKGYCRCGDHKDKTESIFETITCSILEKVASKNEFIRHVSIPGQLRLFAVDEKRSKLPTMALMIVRKDLFYYAWDKQATPMDDEQLDQTWSSMTFKSFVVRQSAPLPPQPALIKSAHFQPYY
ncbi:hypothetical protein L3Y34_015921 [Caenorhabditis briggsae]|uniref:Uncharacterized protein n=1 Tax=Caenorhabditis briggsae TaxID=6238 RepID=A0AAE9IZR0_CAEBR|nr:hypothetical protein L3Y34_015921 [Caenorhabditis briggsae]